MDESYKNKVKELINLANKKGVIKKYSEFCEGEEGDKNKLQEEENAYYISKMNKQKFKIGDIVFVSNYIYKSGLIGKNHIFVIIEDNQAIDINYFGFLVSSQLYKSTYNYNIKILKNNINNLYKDSIVKCDDLIKISESEIQFKIGEVTKEELKTFIEVYERYLSEK